MNIKLAENFRAVFYAPFYATLALGFHQEEGVDIKLIESPSPGSGIADLVQGRLDVVWGGPLRVIRERDQVAPVTGSSLVAFCEVAAKDPFYLVGRGDHAAVCAESIDGAPFDIRALAAMRLGSVSEVPTPWLCLEQDLRDRGVDPSALSRIADRTMQQNIDALNRGEIDVAQVFEPFVSIAQQQGAQVLAAASARGYTAYTTFISTYDGVSRNREAFEAMIRAVEKFGPWLREHGPVELARVVAPFYPHVSPDILERAMTRYQLAQLWTCRRVVSRAGYARLVQSMFQSGYISTLPRYEDCIADFSAESP